LKFRPAQASSLIKIRAARFWREQIIIFRSFSGLRQALIRYFPNEEFSALSAAAEQDFYRPVSIFFFIMTGVCGADMQHAGSARSHDGQGAGGTTGWGFPAG
jgi:hypothetical protein